METTGQHAMSNTVSAAEPIDESKSGRDSRTDPRGLAPAEVALNTSLHQHLLSTNAVKASTLASAMLALADLRHRRAAEAFAAKPADEHEA